MTQLHNPLPIFAWYAGSSFAAVGIGWLATMLHAAGYAPIGIVSLGVGIALGIVLGALAARMRVLCRRRLVIGALVMALLTVFAEHAWLYREFRRQWHAARASSAQVAMFRPNAPWPPAEYVAREASAERGALWALDALLIGAAAVGTTLRVARYAAQSPIETNSTGRVTLEP